MDYFYHHYYGRYFQKVGTNCHVGRRQNIYFLMIFVARETGFMTPRVMSLFHKKTVHSFVYESVREFLFKTVVNGYQIDCLLCTAFFST